MMPKTGSRNLAAGAVLFLIIMLLIILLLFILLPSCAKMIQTPLEVISSSPKAASGIEPEGLEISVTFNRIPQKVRAEEAFSLTADGIEPPGRIAWQENKLLFNPYKKLETNKKYIIRVTTGAEDIDGNSLAEDFSLTFYTGIKSLRPAVVSVSPEPFSKMADSLCPIVVIFDQEMDWDSLLEGFQVSPSVTGISALSEDGLRFTFSPTEELGWQKDYCLTISGKVHSTAGGSLGEDYIWSFRLGAEDVPPEIVSASSFDKAMILTPSPSANPTLETNTGWEKDESIRIVFSEEIEQNIAGSAVNIEPAAPFSISWDNEAKPYEMIINWDEQLEWKKLYRLEFSTAIKDLQGNSMEEEKIYYLYIDGARSRPPLLSRVNFIPDQNSAVILFDSETPENGTDSHLILDTTGGDSIQDLFYIDYYFTLAESAILPFFEFIDNFLISPGDSCLTVTYLNFQLFNPGDSTAEAAVPKPLPGLNDSVLRLLCSVTDSKSSSGTILFQVYDDLQDSLGNRMEEDWRLELFDEDN